jgi:hypothetical protein
MQIFCQKKYRFCYLIHCQLCFLDYMMPSINLWTIAIILIYVGYTIIPISNAQTLSPQTPVATNTTTVASTSGCGTLCFVAIFSAFVAAMFVIAVFTISVVVCCVAMRVSNDNKVCSRGLFY